MKKLFAVALVASFLSVAASSFAGVDYIQYRDDFKSQENIGKQYQHKSKQVREEMNQNQLNKTKSFQQKEHDYYKNKYGNEYQKKYDRY